MYSSYSEIYDKQYIAIEVIITTEGNVYNCSYTCSYISTILNNQYTYVRTYLLVEIFIANNMYAL